jgi:DNA-directed RNA polymerase specialized sigma24 family protein
MTESNAIGPSGVYGAMHAQIPTTFGSGAGPALPAEAAEPAPEPYVSDHAPAVTDQAGFSAFYQDAWPSVARALAIALGDRDLAVDATDEAMARAYPRWGRLRGYDNPAGWVYRVGLNWARSHHRRMSRRRGALDRAEPVPPPVSDPEVRAALMALPLKLRSVVVCRLLLDWSVADTAKALGVRPGTVQSRLHRAIQTLEVSLEHLR